MVSEAQKKATAKYQTTRYKAVACKLKIEEYEKLKAYAESRGLTVNGLLKQFILECISEDSR